MPTVGGAGTCRPRDARPKCGGRNLKSLAEPAYRLRDAMPPGFPLKGGNDDSKNQPNQPLPTPTQKPPTRLSQNPRLKP